MSEQRPSLGSRTTTTVVDHGPSQGYSSKEESPSHCCHFDPDLAAAMHAVPSPGAVVRRLLHPYLWLCCVRRCEKGDCCRVLCVKREQERTGQQPLHYLKKKRILEILERVEGEIN